MTLPDQDTQAPEAPGVPRHPGGTGGHHPRPVPAGGNRPAPGPCGLHGGVPWGTFQPETQLTRAQAAQILYRLLADPDSGTGDCGYTDVADSDWFAQPARALCALGIFDNGAFFRPNDVITRAEFVALLLRVNPQEGGDGHLPRRARHPLGGPGHRGSCRPGLDRRLPRWDLPSGERPDPGRGLRGAQPDAGPDGDSAQANKLMTLGLFADVPASHWAATTIAEAAVQHTPVDNGSGETWTGVDLTQMTFQAGIHQVDGQLYYVDRDGNLAVNQVVGAYTAGSDGALVQTATSYQLPYVPYISQIDNIYAWVGCEAVSTLMGLQAKGYATDVSVKYFLDNLPRHSSNPEKGFVGSPYVPDTSKRTRPPSTRPSWRSTPTATATGDVVCADFRGPPSPTCSGSCWRATAWWPT